MHLVVKKSHNLLGYLCSRQGPKREFQMCCENVKEKFCWPSYIGKEDLITTASFQDGGRIGGSFLHLL